MAIRIKCPCNQLLDVPESASGKQTRCPRCQTLLQIPVVAAPQSPLAGPFSDPQSLPSEWEQKGATPPRYPTSQNSAPKRPKAKSAGSPNGSLIAWVVGGVVGLASLGGLAAWLLLSLFGGGQLIENDFVPVEPLADTSSTPATPVVDSQPAAGPLSGRNTSESAMLTVAETFVRHARQNEHHEAVAMIDSKLFHTRLYGPKGSYEAMTKDISASKLLSNFAGYALDGAPIGGRRHWSVVGTSQYDGNPGVVLRYYVEPQSPLETLTDPKLFNRLGALVTYEQMSQSAANLFSKDGQKKSQFDQYDLGTHAIRSAFPSRAGYMMLVFDTQGSEPRIVDLVNVLGQAPLSKTGAHVFLDDYRVFGGFGERETYGTKPCTISVYGVSERTSGATWNANDPGGEERAKQKAANETAIVERKRPKRLEKLMELWQSGSASLEAELSAFRSDFPSDLGFELAMVFHKMSAKSPSFVAADDARIVPAAKALYAKWRDPFFLYVEGLCALQNGRQAEADKLFEQCFKAGFAPSECYLSRIRAAVDRSDSATILSALKDWNQTFAGNGMPPDSELLNKLSQRYEKLDRSLNPQPTMGEMMGGGMRERPGRPGGRPGPGFPSDRFGARAGSGDSMDRSDPSNPPFGNGPPFGPPGAPGSPNAPWNGMGPPPGFPSGPPVPSSPQGPQVVVEISSSKSYDGNKIVKELAKKLGTQSYGFSQSNNTAKLTISYAGTLQSVVQAIDFGTISKTDEGSRTISVTIP